MKLVQFRNNRHMRPFPIPVGRRERPNEDNATLPRQCTGIVACHCSTATVSCGNGPRWGSFLGASARQSERERRAAAPGSFHGVNCYCSPRPEVIGMCSGDAPLQATNGATRCILKSTGSHIASHILFLWVLSRNERCTAVTGAVPSFTY